MFGYTGFRTTTSSKTRTGAALVTMGSCTLGSIGVAGDTSMDVDAEAVLSNRSTTGERTLSAGEVVLRDAADLSEPVVCDRVSGFQDGTFSSSLRIVILLMPASPFGASLLRVGEALVDCTQGTRGLFSSLVRLSSPRLRSVEAGTEDDRRLDFLPHGKGMVMVMAMAFRGESSFFSGTYGWLPPSSFWKLSSGDVLTNVLASLDQAFWSDEGDLTTSTESLWLAWPTVGEEMADMASGG
jgi:hypothetical protein